MNLRGQATADASGTADKQLIDILDIGHFIPTKEASKCA
jgi:hypothetical protein